MMLYPYWKYGAITTSVSVARPLRKTCSCSLSDASSFEGSRPSTILVQKLRPARCGRGPGRGFDGEPEQGIPRIQQGSNRNMRTQVGKLLSYALLDLLLDGFRTHAYRYIGNSSVEEPWKPQALKS